MKKSVVLLSVSLMLFCTVGSVAQPLVPIAKTEKEKAFELRRMEAFAGADVKAIPFNSGVTLSDYTDPAKKRNYASELQPLSTNAALERLVREKSRQAKVSANPVDDLTVDAVLSVAGWGTLYCADNDKLLVYTAEYSQSPAAAWFLNGVRYTFYSDNLSVIASFELKTPDTTHTISMMGQYSEKMFNSDTNKEFMVQVHSFAGGGSGPESCRDTLFIINEKGEVLKKLGQTSGATLDKVRSDVSDFPENRISVFDAYYSDLSDTMYTYVYKARDIVDQSTPKPIYTFRIPDNLTAYSTGPLSQYMEIEGKGYYVTSQYEKPFIVDMDNMVTEKNNKYNIFLYDKDFELVKKIALPLPGIEDNDLSMSNLLYFEDYMLSRHIFNSDDKFEVIYGMSRYDISCDCEKLQYYLMDEDGKILKDIVEGVGSVVKLQDIPGQSDEYALMMGGGDVITGIKMLKMPSMEESFTFPAVHENELLSANFERVPAVGGDYNYIFGLGRGESADNTVYGGIMYYNRQGKSVKRVRIDLGANALTFQPVITSMTMNPYSIVPDNKQEYLYFSRYSEGDGIGACFAIANDETTLYKWRDNDKDGIFGGAGLRSDEDSKMMKNLYITFTKNDTTRHTFYKLPLVDVVLQGKGTKEEPYIITTPAELDQVRNYPSAYFVLGNDIDMAAFTGVGQRGFVGIPDFKGHFDGKNHYIKNLTLADQALFSTLSGTVENLMLRNVVFTSGKLRMAGCIAGYAPLTGKIKNCHVEADIRTNAAGSAFGGIVGQAIGGSEVEECSFTGRIVVPNMDKVGGIAGYITTSSGIFNSFAKGHIQAAQTAGGIVGSTMSQAKVINSYASVNVSTLYQAGGIVGDNSASNIVRTYATGKIEVGENNDRWSRGAAGGIAGETTLNTMFGGGIVKYSVALNDTIIAPKDFARVAYTGNYGYTTTTLNDTGGKVPVSYMAMDSNYALQTMLVGVDEVSLKRVPASDTNLKVNRKHGLSGTLEEFNEEFYKKITWNFGQDSAHPWQMMGQKPRLWYEFKVRGVELPYAELTLPKDSSFTMQAMLIPAEATNQQVRWRTSNPRVVSVVDPSGVIKAMGEGTATITVATEDGNCTASCEVTVIIPVAQVVFAEKELVIEPQKVITVSSSVLPENATNKKVRYYSLNTSILSASGNMIYGNEVGDAKLVAISEDGYASDTCMVYVRIKINGIYLNVTSISLNKEKPTFQLVAEVDPTEADASELIWKSADESVCTVSETGLVSGHKKGNTEVTVSTKDGSVEAICLVAVEEFIDNANEEAEPAKVNVYYGNGQFVVAAASEIASVKVYDLGGHCLASVMGVGADKAYIPASRYAAGVYMIQAELVDGRMAIVKVIK